MFDTSKLEWTREPESFTISDDVVIYLNNEDFFTKIHLIHLIHLIIGLWTVMFLYAHLLEVEYAAQDLLDSMMPGIAKEAGGTENLLCCDISVTFLCYPDWEVVQYHETFSG